jgi:hypothetical protein
LHKGLTSLLTYLLTYEIYFVGQGAQRAERILGTVQRKHIMLRSDHLTAAQDLVRHANSERDRLLVQLLETMTSRIVQLEARLDQFDCNDQASFNDRVLEVLEVRSGTARVALGLSTPDIHEAVLSVIEDNSGTVYSHIEAEIEEKIDTFSQSYSFSEAVAEAVKGSVAEVVEEIIEDRISTDFLDADATDVVRKGLRSLL